MANLYHAITPGDHYSPRTGSAIPTVVHGLAQGARAANDDHRWIQKVVLQADTYQPRYESAVAVDYRGVAAPSIGQRYLDLVGGYVGYERRYTQRYWRPVAEALRQEPAGMVLAHNAQLLPWLMRDSEHTTLLYCHNYLLGKYSKREVSSLMSPAARIVCVSASLASRHCERLPLHLQERIRVVPNGCDVLKFSPGADRLPGPMRVMFLGRTIPEKGADVLLRAARQLGGADVEFSIVGSHGFDPTAPLTPYERQLRNLASLVPAAVTFEPFVNRQELPKVLRQADVLVVPSRWAEPFALTVAEGMASGLSVVASRIGGIPEVIGDAGILFDPTDPGELAEALATLARDPQKRNLLGMKARRRAELHDWAWSWRQLASVLDELAE